MTPWFGLHLPNYTFPGTPPEQLFERIVEQAQTAERAGFSLVTVMDRLYQIGGVGPVDDPMLEGWSVLNALARETTRVRLGTLVSGVTYRNPAMLAKMAPERRAHAAAGPPEAAAEALQPYLDAGFTGFTFNNSTYRTPESIAAVGELLRLIS